MLSSFRSVITLGTSTAPHEEEEESECETRLKKYFLDHSHQVLFSCPSSVKECEGSKREKSCSFWIGKHLTASQWENMDQFRAVRAVVVVLDCNTLVSCDIKDVFSNIKVVLESNFPDVPCRCIVFNPPKLEMLPLSQYSKLFVFVSPEDSVEDISGKILAGISAEVVQKNEEKLLLVSSSGISHMNDVRIPIRTTVDKTSSLNLERPILLSRCAKVKGDLLLQLGDVDGAIEAYGATYFSSKVDPLWRSATLEAIAACRFRKVQGFLSSAHEKWQALKNMENKRSAINESIISVLAEIESNMKKLHEDYRKDLKVLKKSAIPSLLYKILRQEASSLKALLTSFSAAVQSAREACTSKDDEQANIYSQLNSSFSGFTSTLQKCILELLKGSLFQLREACTIFGTSFSEREIEIHSKLMTFYAYCKQQGNFLSEMQTTLQLTAERPRAELIRRVLMYCVLLCSSCGCYRTAIALLVQVAKKERERKYYHLAVDCIIYACALVGIDISNPLGLPPSMSQVNFMLCEIVREIRKSTSCSAPLSLRAADCEAVGMCRISHSKFEVLLLNELTDTLAEMAMMRSGVLCRMSLYLLFRYHKLLDSQTQEKLIQYISEDSFSVPFYHIEESVCPVIISIEPLALPSHLAPKSIPVSGPMFTYIDIQRFQHTVLCWDGKKLKNNVIWAVGDVGLVKVMFLSPFKHLVVMRSLLLRCKNVSGVHDVKKDDDGAQDIPFVKDGEDPLCYSVENITLGPGELTAVSLAVMPRSKGTMEIVGVECQLNFMGSTTIGFSTPQPVSVPVMQQLPLISCINHTPNLRMFEGQDHSFMLSISNCSRVPVEKISLTAHSKTCQLEDCKGCCEVAIPNEFFVELDKSTFLSKLPLGVSETRTVEGTVHSPSHIDSSYLHLVYFRIDYSVNYPPVDPPRGVSSAIPVFGVVPRRVLEIQWPIFFEVGIVVKQLELSYNRCFFAIRFENLNDTLRTCLVFSASISSLFACEDAVIDPLAEYVTPWIKVERIKTLGGKPLSIPWTAASTPKEKILGNVVIDFSSIAFAKAAEQVSECVISAEIRIHPENKRFFWSSDRPHFECPESKNYSCSPSEKFESCSSSSSVMCCAPFSVVHMTLTIKSPWKKRKKVLCCVSLSTDNDMGSLTGPTKSVLSLGCDCDAVREFELIPFSCGLYILTTALVAGTQNTVYYHMYFNVAGKSITCQ